MFGNAFSGWHALIILVVVLLLFGAPKLPALARSLGQSMKILKSEIKPDASKDAAAGDAPAASVAPAAAAPAATVAPAPTAPAANDADPTPKP